MEEALHDVPLFRAFAGLAGDQPPPDETTILRFRRLLEAHRLGPHILLEVNALLAAKGLMLRSGTVVDATLIAAPSSTKNQDELRDPEMHSSQNGKQWYFGMKAHIGVDAESGLVHTVRGTTGSVHDVVQANALLHGEEAEAWGDARATRVLTSGPMPPGTRAGTSRCVQASAKSWRRADSSGNSPMSWSASRPASGPRSSTRFAYSRGNGGM